jgi:HD-like signal output (HDOD) protein
LRIETSQLEEFLAQRKQESTCIEPAQTNASLESQLYYDLFKDIQEDTLILPSLPEVAVRIRSLLDKEDVSANQIASVVRIDSGIAAKLVKVANSALYGGVMPVESLSQAIVRLGMRTTSDLVFYFTFSNLFRTKSDFLRERMKSLWQHCAHVGATSYVLAKNVSGFDPERALLMGLLHDVGAVAILSYADKYPEVTDNPQIIEGVVTQLRGKVGAMILCKWNFQEDFITTALEAEKWYRNPSPRPDYCDLVMIAQLHSFIDKPGVVDVPPMNQLPAFSKLALGQLTPQLGLKMLDAAKEEIDEIMKILAM